MLNVGNVELWVTTLSVSLASSIVLMPIFVIVHYATGQTLQDADRRRRHEQGPVLDEQPPFVDEDEQEEAMPVSDSASPNQK